MAWAMGYALAMDTNADSLEIELKLRCTRIAYQRLLELPLFKQMATGRATVHQLRTRYFDTIDHDLRKAGLSLRLRYEDEEIIQCVKFRRARVGGLEFRGEYESRLAVPVPDIRMIPDAQVRERVEEIGATGFIPLFETRFQRTSWPLRTAQGTQLRIDLDQGEIRVNEKGEALCELELGLQHGDPGELFQLALQVHQQVPLQLSILSKAERGFSHLSPQELVGVKAKSLSLPADASIGNLFVLILRNGLEHLMANEAGLLNAGMEAVHQARVALRRLRTFVALFCKQLPGDKVRWLRVELKWAHRALAPLRDWDVLISDFLETVKFEPGQSQSLRAYLAHLREADAQGVTAVIKSPRYTQFLLTFGLWIYQLEQGCTSNGKQGKALRKPAKAFIEKVLSKRLRRVMKDAENLSSKTDEQRHQLRIELKKLRYAAHAFQSRYPNKKAHPFLVAIGRFQDALGHLNDAANASSLLSDLGTEEADIRFAAGMVVGWHMQQKSQLLLRSDLAFGKFCDCKSFW